MNSTRGRGVTRSAYAYRWLLSGLLCFLGATSVWAADSSTVMPRPPELERDVQFWIRVYSEVDTNGGFLHDQYNLAVVYETLHFAPNTSPHERERIVDQARSRYGAALRRIAAAKDGPLSAEDQHIKDMWGAEGTPSRLLEAIDDIRFQLGQSDRFRAGLVRSGAWETHIAETLANLGLPAELAVLPHVESSFNPAAYSKVGAAGLWQFMRSTGRRYMRIDNAVDERMDPFRATEAAAQLLSYNYRLLGSWPLAITAYNHGSEGMLRAREQLGTDDIVRVVREYHSPTFGFASRNFYVSFLAALTIAENPDKYFGALRRGAEPQFVEVKLSTSASSAALVKTLGVERDTLRELNPALRPAVWNGQRAIPAGYVVRLPGSATQWTSDLLAQRLGAAKPVLVAAVTPPANLPPAANAPVAKSRAATPPAPAVAAAAPGAPAAVTNNSSEAAASDYYLVQSDDTVQTIAARTGVTVAKLMALNSIPDADYLYGGERLRLVAAAPEPETVTTAATLDSAKNAVQENQEEQQAVAAADKAATTNEPVTAAQAQAEGPELAPSITGQDTADPVD